MKEIKVTGIRYKKNGSGKKRQAVTCIGNSAQTRPGKFVHLSIREEGEGLAWIHLTAKKACKLGMALLDEATSIDAEVIR